VQVDAHINNLYNTTFWKIVKEIMTPPAATDEQQQQQQQQPQQQLQSEQQPAAASNGLHAKASQSPAVLPSAWPRGLSEKAAREVAHALMHSQYASSAAKHELLHSHFHCNYNDEPAEWRKATILLWKDAQAHAQQVSAAVARTQAQAHTAAASSEGAVVSAASSNESGGAASASPARLGSNPYLHFLQSARPAYLDAHPELRTSSQCHCATADSPEARAAASVRCTCGATAAQLQITKGLTAQWKALDAEKRREYEQLAAAAPCSESDPTAPVAVAAPARVVVQLHEDLIQDSFYTSLHPGIVPYVAQVDARKAASKEDKARRKATHKEREKADKAAGAVAAAATAAASQALDAAASPS